MFVIHFLIGIKSFHTSTPGYQIPNSQLFSPPSPATFNILFLPYDCALFRTYLFPNSTAFTISNHSYRYQTKGVIVNLLSFHLHTSLSGSGLIATKKCQLGSWESSSHSNYSDFLQAPNKWHQHILEGDLFILFCLCGVRIFLLFQSKQQNSDFFPPHSHWSGRQGVAISSWFPLHVICTVEISKNDCSWFQIAL